MSVLWALLALAGLIGGANVAIRRALAAPRVVETASPQGLPWRAVQVPTVNGKRLFGWFIPAGERAPAPLLTRFRPISTRPFPLPCWCWRRNG